MKNTNGHILKTRPFRFGIVGEFQSGKSLLVNCLLKRSIASVGHGNATTHTVVNYQFSDKEYAECLFDDGEVKSIPIEEINQYDTRTDVSVINVYLKNEFLESFILMDIPGFGANEADTCIAERVFPEIDFVILVTSNDTAIGGSSATFRDIHILQKNNVPYYLLLNCTNKNRWRCDDHENVNIAKANINLLDSYKPLNYPLQENGINIVNFMWYWYSISDNDDELINRSEYQYSFDEYGINIHVKDDLGKASNFYLIDRIFDMDNRAFLELRREMKEGMERLKREICPIGTIQAFSCKDIPDGWLLCDGSSVQVDKYPDLFRVIGFTFGGNNVESFQLPDLRGRFIRGWDSTGINDESREFGSVQEDAFQSHGHNTEHIKGTTESGGSHSHSLYREEHGGGMGTVFYSLNHEDNCISSNCKKGRVNILKGGYHNHSFDLDVKVSSPSDDKSGSVRFAKETRPKNIAMLYCIKCI